MIEEPAAGVSAADRGDAPAVSAEQLLDELLARLDDADRPPARGLDLLGLVDPEHPAHARHEVLDADGAIDHLGAVAVGLADRLPALDPAASQHAAPPLRPVIAAALVVDLRR